MSASSGSKPQYAQMPEAALGQDLGNIASKCTLGLLPEGNGPPVLLRVYANVPTGHQERTRTPYASNFQGEFSAYAAWDPDTGTLVAGRSAFARANSFSLKLIALHRSKALDRKLINTWSMGPELLRGVDTGKFRITPDKEDAVFCEHLKHLRDQSVQMATARGWKITKVVLTHPFFLHGADIDKFQRYYESKMRSVWKPYEEQIDQVITFQWCSEGQGLANYICEPFDDMQSVFLHKKLWDHFSKLLNKRLGHLNVVVFDNGSSTMDIQVQTVYFNDEGAYKCSTSDFEEDWPKGAMSGSHMANEELRKLLRSDFQDNCSEEDIPIFLEKFEAMKDTLDPDKLPLDMQGQSKTTLALIGSDPQQSVTLTQNQLQLIYQKAFGPGFKAFKKTITNLLAFGKDFAVILGGGSFQSPWLARQVKEFLDAIQKKALQQPSPVLLLYALLTDFDSAFPSAVSAGAVLSAIRRKPSPMQWLKQSAFGLQRWRTSKEGDPWSPNWMAEFLLAEGCSEIPTVILNNLRPAYAKWRLILDTQYHMRPMENRYRMIKGRKVYFGIWVSQAKETIFDTLQSVDANWEITGLQLPAGKIACSVRGPQAVKFANGWGDEMPDTFVLGLDFFQINDEGTRLKHKSDKRFNLTIASDIAANMAQVVKAQELPVWCQGCRYLISMGHICQSCPSCSWSLCNSCFDIGVVQHDHDYTLFDAVQVGSDEAVE